MKLLKVSTATTAELLAAYKCLMNKTDLEAGWAYTHTCTHRYMNTLLLLHIYCYIHSIHLHTQSQDLQTYIHTQICTNKSYCPKNFQYIMIFEGSCRGAVRLGENAICPGLSLP